MRVVVTSISELSGHEENHEGFRLDLREARNVTKIDCFLWSESGQRKTIGVMHILDNSGQKSHYPSEDEWCSQFQEYMIKFFYMWPDVSGMVVTVNF